MDDTTYDDDNACKHHWMLEPATAPESHGRCSLCGTERTFSNAPAFRYDRDPVPRMDRNYRSGARSTHRERVELSDEA